MIRASVPRFDCWSLPRSSASQLIATEVIRRIGARHNNIVVAAAISDTRLKISPGRPLRRPGLLLPLINSPSYATIIAPHRNFARNGQAHQWPDSMPQLEREIRRWLLDQRSSCYLPALAADGSATLNWNSHLLAGARLLRMRRQRLGTCRSGPDAGVTALPHRATAAVPTRASLATIPRYGLRGNPFIKSVTVALPKPPLPLAEPTVW